MPLPKCNRFSPPNASNASGRPGSRSSSAGCRRTCDAKRSDARRRSEEALAHTAPLASPIVTVRRGQRLAERHRLPNAPYQVAGSGHADVFAGNLDAVAFAAEQLAGGFAIFV